MNNIFGILVFFIIKFISSQMCGPQNPSTRNECFQSSNSVNVCCFAKVASKYKNDTTLSSTNLCLLIKRTKTFIAPYLTKMDLGINNFDIDINLDCGDDFNTVGQYRQCGLSNPETFTDCQNSSTPNSTCCFFKSKNGNATCLSNPGIIQGNETIFGVVIACIERILNINYFKHIIFIILILIIM